MSETKVLHEWKDEDGHRHWIEAGRHGIHRRYEHSPNRAWGDPAVDELARLAADHARLTRELSEAREAINTAPIETDGSGCYKGRAMEWFALPAVRAAVEEGK